MSGESSEEKTLPPTQEKLRKQRKKGSVVTAKDALASIGAVTAISYLYMRRDSIAETLTALWILEPLSGQEAQPFGQQLQDKVAIIWDLTVWMMVPFIALIIVVAILCGMMIAGGPLFAPEALAPKFEKINPAAGLKRIFNRKAMVTFLMHLVRVTALLLVFTLILVGGWSALLRAPICGFGCTVEGLEAASRPLVLAAGVVMLTMAIFDYLVQRSEFMREQKMTMTEFKKEMKDQQGDPHLREKLRQDQRHMVESPTGAKQAVLIVEGHGNVAYGIRYVEGETPAPLVVSRARDRDGISRMTKTAGCLSVEDSEMADLLRGKAVGDYVTEDEGIERLAPLLQRAMAGTDI